MTLTLMLRQKHSLLVNLAGRPTSISVAAEPEGVLTLFTVLIPVIGL